MEGRQICFVDLVSGTSREYVVAYGDRWDLYGFNKNRRISWAGSFIEQLEGRNSGNEE